MTQSKLNLIATANETEQKQQEFLNSKPVVGQSLFMVTPQRNRRPITESVTVEKVGTKYFTLSEVPHTKFNIRTKTEASDYHSDITLYASGDCYEHETMKSKLKNEIRQAIRNFGTCALNDLSFADLTTVADILLKKNDTKEANSHE
ncbi:beta barrel domain-containing protein [Psychrobacter celer]|uniref:beta barrel domain-containing protein n=1 Tax=Psychrobacter celer TaxID=306572 RepID=UPI003FD68605